MKTFLILGAGTGGTMVANKMANRLDPEEWRMVVVDRDETHYYQPGFLFIPFGIYSQQDVIKSRRTFIPRNVELIISDIERIEPDANQVRLKRDNQVIRYDYLVIATGCEIRPDQTEGLKGDGWYKNVFDYYTIEGATALGEFLKTWPGGRMVLNVTEMPIKCPIAPLEFLFTADWFFQRRGMRNKVEIVFATPLPGAFTKPRASAAFGDILARKGVQVEAEFNIGAVDNEKQVIRSWDEREIPYDLLVTIPTNMGAEVIKQSGMGDPLNFVPVNKNTLQSNKWENVWIIGDAGNVPASKAGSVAHFMLEGLIENIFRHMKGEKPEPEFDGHANCFIESGFGKSLLIDFNFDVEPLPGSFPFPRIGPFPLLKESRLNHLGKMGFRWMYWNLLLPGRPIPFISSRLSMAGKKL